LYLDAVCSAGDARLLVWYRAEGFLANESSTAESAVEAVPEAVDAARRAAEVLSDPSVAWPDEVKADIADVVTSERANADALEANLSGVTKDNFATAWQKHKDRPSSSTGAGERVREYFGLGQPGDCMKGAYSNEIYMAMVLQLSPTLKNRSSDEVLALGQQACSMRSADLTDSLITDELVSAGLQAFESGTVLSAADAYLCPPTPGASEPTPADKGDVDAVLDHFIAANLLLTQMKADTTEDALAQVEAAQREWAKAGDALRVGVPGIPEETSDAVLKALDRTQTSMTAYVRCARSSTAAACDDESSATAEEATALGTEVALLIPYGSRSGDEYIAALEGGGAASAATETQSPPQDTGTATVSQSNALEKAAEYLDYSAFSRQGLIDQLEYEGFSNADATYGADAVGADWNQQAALKAQEYLDYSGFSRTGLIQQLEYEGFTRSQAAFGADAAGL
jgi:hypothetical protein